jgi:hypothetical protein
MIDPRPLRLSQLQTPSCRTLVFLDLADLVETDARLHHICEPDLSPADYVVLTRRGGRARLLPLVSQDIGKLPFSLGGKDRSGYAGLLDGDLKLIPQVLDVAAADLERVASTDLLGGSRCRRLGEVEFAAARRIETMLLRHGLSRRASPLHHLLDPGRN